MSLLINNLRLDLDMKLMSELSIIERFDATWSNIEKREHATLKQLKSIATVKSVGASTRIEGSKMTDDEVAVFLDKIHKSSFEGRDQQEVAGYFETLDIISENFASIEITESQIKGLHNFLLKHREKDACHQGEYKQVSNVVEANLLGGTKQIIFETTDPGLQTQDAMARLIDWYHQDQENFHWLKPLCLYMNFLVFIHFKMVMEDSVDY